MAKFLLVTRRDFLNPNARPEIFERAFFRYSFSATAFIRRQFSKFVFATDSRFLPAGQILNLCI